jgi:hypothetical protein
MKPIFNVYNGGQNGDVFLYCGICPTLRSGQGVVGRGIGSSNAPKILVIYETKVERG